MALMKTVMVAIPNPAFETLYISTDTAEPKSISLFDMTGKLLLIQTVTTAIDVSKLSAGIYVLKASSLSGDKVGYEKVIIAE